MIDKITFNICKDFDQLAEDTHKSIDFLRKFSDVELMVDSQEAYEKYAFLRFMITAKDHDLPEIHKVVEKSKGDELICKILVNLAPKCEEFVFETSKKPPFDFAYKSTNLNERKIYFLLYSLYNINYLLPNSLSFRSLMIEKKGLKSLLNLLRSEKFIQNVLEFDASYVGNIIYDLNWLSRTAEKNKSIWYELNAIQIILNYSKKFKKSITFAYMAIANIAYDKDIENIREINDSIDIFASFTIKCINNNQLTYVKQEFIDEETNKKYEFNVKSILDTQESVSVSITGLLITLYRLSLNQKMKWEIYQKVDLKESLIKLISQGNEVEKQYTLRLITQLCFDYKVLEDIRKELNLIEYVRKLATENVKFKKLTKTCEQFLWLIKPKTIESTITETDDSIQQIMMSFNSASKDLCSKIKDALENLNFKVWMDIDDDVTSAKLDQMANYLVSSKCFLMCVTEKYRQSLNCQTEAQHALWLNKPIIPLIFQEGYHKIDGWVGFIMGDRPYVDFTNYSFDECINQLINLIASNSQTKINSQQEGDSIKIDESAPLTWNEPTVEKWLNEKGFSDIWDSIKPTDGKMLHQLHLIQVETPQFFYQSLNKNNNLDFSRVISFSSALKELFDKESN